MSFVGIGSLSGDWEPVDIVFMSGDESLYDTCRLT